MAIIAVPQLKDNYAYLLSDDQSDECAVVDCAEADKVLAAAKAHGLRPSTVLSTHFHRDHVGGNLDLAAAVPGLRVYGARAENGRIPALTDPVDDGNEVRVASLRGRAIGIPAHTNGHVAYYFPSLKAAFTGDTLFIAGCGRLFEGQADTMVNSLAKLMALPDDTAIYCGHEYTENNLRFALTLEPHNPKLVEKYAWARAMREQGRFTVPSTVAAEKQFNPFVRTDSEEIRATLARLDPSLPKDSVAIFARIRQLKDKF
jgi:hydroxyacylglutathione hydrolase